jgi:glutamate racemase
VIGVFDSGVGGLSIWREIVKLLPDEPILYLADQACVPYGPRALEDVKALTTRCVTWMIAQGCAMMVIACNTASAAALHDLRAQFPHVPFVGMEPAVKPAVLHTHTGVIGVLATQATFQGKLFASVVARFATGVRVIEQPCPGWVEMVEGVNGWERINECCGSLPAETNYQSPITNHYLHIARYVTPVLDAGADSLVLGCTHFPFLTPQIQQVIGQWMAQRPALPYEVAVIDPSVAVARQVARVCAQMDDQAGLNSERNRYARSYGQQQFWTTGDPARFSAVANRLLSDHVSIAAQHVTLGC